MFEFALAFVIAQRPNEKAQKAHSRIRPDYIRSFIECMYYVAFFDIFFIR